MGPSRAERMTAMADEPVCFVVMGFGKKTDYESGRTLDLDATYESIIKPAVTSAGLRCIRADEVMHSGVIDQKMFDMLLRADLVVADLSTSNANAFYELGVRHALKPYATIIMKESKGRLYFDLNHVSTLQYEHLETDIGAREAKRAQAELRQKIDAVMAAKETDSPVYTFLPALSIPHLAEVAAGQPRVSEAEFGAAVDKAEVAQERLAALVKQGEAAAREDRHGDAAKALAAAVRLKPDPYLIQQLALHTYRSKEPSEREALEAALAAMKPLDPDNSNDPETLGITGAIYKRLWGLTRRAGASRRGDPPLRARLRDKTRLLQRRECRDLPRPAGRHPEGRGGEALRPDERQEDPAGARLAAQRAHRVARLRPALRPAMGLCVVANVAFALGETEVGSANEALFRSEKPAKPEIASFESGKRQALEVAGKG